MLGPLLLVIYINDKTVGKLVNKAQMTQTLAELWTDRVVSVSYMETVQ